MVGKVKAFIDFELPLLIKKGYIDIDNVIKTPDVTVFVTENTICIIPVISPARIIWVLKK
jgi:hypothetical protein